MSRALQKGQRVRVTVRNRMAGYQPSDKGTVLREATLAMRGERSYAVAMDKDDPAKNGVVFRFDEIEPDV
jgi:hypothetical protein